MLHLYPKKQATLVKKKKKKSGNLRETTEENPQNLDATPGIREDREADESAQQYQIRADGEMPEIQVGQKTVMQHVNSLFNLTSPLLGSHRKDTCSIYTLHF